MSKIRVLVVDDSVVARRLITDALTTDPAIEIADLAATGQLALTKISHCVPDIITLDVHMPEMSGLEVLVEIRKKHPRLPVIMFSSLTERGAAATLDALSLGANDYVTKPANVENRDEAIKRIREELVPKLKAFCPHFSTPISVSPTSDQSLLSIASTIKQKTQQILRRIDIVVIGISTGGPNALATLIPTFPSDFPVPILIVQHMPPIFTKFLAERLTAKSMINVTEANNGERLRPGHAWVAPGDYHMIVEQDGPHNRIRTHQEMPENSCRPSVDVLFRSVAKTYRSNSLAIVMTGMGQDGLRGCQDLKEAGSQIFVQDEASSVVWGMPGFVANSHLADRVLPLEKLGPEIIAKVKEGRAFKSAI